MNYILILKKIIPLNNEFSFTKEDIQIVNNEKALIKLNKKKREVISKNYFFLKRN